MSTDTNPRIRVLLSSTWTDLQAERAAVEGVMRRMQETDFNGMEYFGSRPETPLKASLAEVDRSDLYVGIFGRRYGSGITEAEYRRACQRGLAPLIYILGQSLLDDRTETDETDELVSLRDELLGELQKAHTVTRFTSPSELAILVATDLHREIVALLGQRAAPGRSIIDGRIESTAAGDSIGLRSSQPVEFRPGAHITSVGGASSTGVELTGLGPGHASWIRFGRVTGMPGAHSFEVGLTCPSCGCSTGVRSQTVVGSTALPADPRCANCRARASREGQ